MIRLTEELLLEQIQAASNWTAVGIMEVIKEVPLEVEITEEQVTEERQEEALAIKEDNLDQLLNPKTELCLLAI